jgi:hypothetical protein
MPVKTQAQVSEERIRINLVVNREVKDRIEHLQALSAAPSITEVVRRALAVYEELLNIREEGSRLVIEGSGEREILRII